MAAGGNRPQLSYFKGSVDKSHVIWLSYYLAVSLFKTGFDIKDASHRTCELLQARQKDID